MPDLPQVQWEDLKAALQAQIDTALQSVAQSVNAASAGELIASEVSGKFRSLPFSPGSSFAGL